MLNVPFPAIRFTQQELKEGKLHVTELTDKWYQDIQASPLLSGALIIIFKWISLINTFQFPDSSDEIDLHIDQDWICA